MFEKYIIREDSLRNVERGGVRGFEIDLRLAYYRGLLLSMVEDIVVTVDGAQVPRDALTLDVAGQHFSLAELEHEYDARWEFHETATLFVAWGKPLEQGQHEIGVTEVLRISYQPTIVRRSNVKEMIAA